MNEPTKIPDATARPSPEPSLKDQWVYSTVRIECQKAKGLSSGTAFLFQFTISPGHIVEALVTNKHVIRGAESGKFCLTVRGPDGNPEVGNFNWFQVPDFENSWIPHPDENVDLCIMPFHAIREAASQGGIPVFLLGIGEDALPAPNELSELGAICDVFMIGYPNGIWDFQNNRPIVRKGITATDPRLNYRGKREFLIDAACFPGSSGSPVFGFREDIVISKNKVLQGEHIHLLGILHAGPQHTAKVKMGGIEIEGEESWTAPVDIPNHLGMVVNFTCLADFNPILRARLKTAPIGT